MKQELGTGGRQGYQRAIAVLRSDLTRTLARLEAIASDPDAELSESGSLEELPSLQYALHAAGESVAGLRPPAGAESSHAELAAALADARDHTAEVADAAISGGAETAWPLVWEWRGALFRVRVAQSRLAPRPPADRMPDAANAASRSAIAVTVLVLVAATTVSIAAILGSWPLAAAGLALAAGSLLAPWQ